MKLKFKKIISRIILTFYGNAAYAKYCGVVIGKNCRIYTSNFGSEPFLIKIGDDVTITQGVNFVTHDGSTWLMRDEKGRRYSYQPIEVGSHVFIGVNCIILPGVKIGSRVIIGAGSVVTKSIPDGSVVAGVPARIIGHYDTIEHRMLTTYISDAEIDVSLDYKSRVLKVVDDRFKHSIVNDGRKD